MKLLRKFADAPYAVAAALAIGMSMLTDEAYAQATSSDLKSMSENVTTQGQAIGKFAIFGMFLVGVVLIGAGLMKLKAAADSQGGQVKYGDGLWRLGVGAALVAVPVLTGVLSTTLGLGKTDITGTEAW